MSGLWLRASRIRLLTTFVSGQNLPLRIFAAHSFLEPLSMTRRDVHSRSAVFPVRAFLRVARELRCAVLEARDSHLAACQFHQSRRARHHSQPEPAPKSPGAALHSQCAFAKSLAVEPLTSQASRSEQIRQKP